MSANEGVAQSISVGASELLIDTEADSADQDTVELRVDADSGVFQKIIFKGNQLRGISAINAPLDPGIMWQLILRRIDLSEVKAEFVARPLETGRRLMSETWR